MCYHAGRLQVFRGGRENEPPSCPQVRGWPDSPGFFFLLLHQNYDETEKGGRRRTTSIIFKISTTPLILSYYTIELYKLLVTLKCNMRPQILIQFIGVRNGTDGPVKRFTWWKSSENFVFKNSMKRNEYFFYVIISHSVTDVIVAQRGVFFQNSPSFCA